MKYRILQKKRERKELNRREKSSERVNSKVNRFHIEEDFKKVDHYNKSFKFFNYLKGRKFFGDGKISSYHKIGKNFTCGANFSKTLFQISEIAESYFNLASISTITLDFSKCKEADLPALFVLKSLFIEFDQHHKRIRNNYLEKLDLGSEIKIILSPSEEVNRRLFILQLTKELEVGNETMHPRSATGIIHGSRLKKEVNENFKSITCTKISNQISKSLIDQGYELKESGRNNLEKIISEILNNAEDHSPLVSWYTHANYFRENESKVNNGVGEINLIFMNLGYSIHEGFEKTKDENETTYFDMDQMVKHIHQNFGNEFSKENLFTLYALQEGFSRLRYEREDRGTGTMTFIRSFLDLGGYEDLSKGYQSKLDIYSGNTRIRCTNEMKPKVIDNVYYLPLNENNLDKPPSRKFLTNLDRYFPGTLLFAKIFISKEHLINLISTDE